ncbi:alpha/beta hydrolase [Candidatus Woesearchaeota archaeon]|nr:alpha/beta hydrolase [Candidatus Woesearchaeota archaeon]
MSKKDKKKRTNKKISKKIKKEKSSLVDNLKKHKKELIRILIVLTILIILYFSSAMMINIRSNYAEQIIMETSPQNININTKQNEKEQILIETEIRTNLFCKTTCEYELKDLSENKILDKGEFYFSNYKKHEYESILSTNKLGSGQIMYLFEISCINYESNMCKAMTLPVIRTALITMNYEPSKEQQLKKEEVQTIINEITELIMAGQTNTLMAQAIVNNISQMKKDHLEKEIIELIFFQNILEKDLDKINEDWKTQNYSYVEQEIKKHNVIEKSLNFKEKANHLIYIIEKEQEIYNEAIQTLTTFREEINLLNQINKIIILSDKEPETNLQEIHHLNLKLLTALNEKKFNNYQELKNLIIDIQNKSLQLKKTHDELKESSFYEINTWIQLMNNDLCLLQNKENCNEKIKIISNETNIQEPTLLCEETQIIQELKKELKEQQETKRQNLTKQEILEIDTEKRLVEQSMLQWQIQQINDTNATKLINLLMNYAQRVNETSNQNYYLNNHNESKQEYFLPLTYLENETQKYFLTCTSELEFPIITKQKELIKEIKIMTPNIKIIEDVSATCCFKNKCESCCDYEECIQQQKNPLIVLHGYSFYSFNSALHSTNAFNDFVKQITQEHKYYPAGIIGPSYYPEYEENELTRNFATPIFKATYYEVLRFGEITPGELSIRIQSITEHAEKLHEIIEYIKKITKKQEVDIIAHSMGGLVTRTYIEKYGENSLGTIILVGTPNQGVPQRLAYLCRFFGGQTECDDMYQESGFMNYINKEISPPKKQIHLLIGTGCNTFGADGDGIVQTRSAELNFTTNYYFEGTCDLVDNFHRDMIKPTKYPEIYEKIKEILMN